jgi:single-strand DNA-binding protein
MTAQTKSAETKSRSSVTAGDSVSVNQIVLSGRLAAEPLIRDLPSGDRLISFRLTVARNDPASKVQVDTIDCATSRSSLIDRIARYETGQVLALEGSLQRRFWRSPTGPASRYQVMVHAVRRVRE